MSKVQINNVVVLNNPATYTSPFQFEITFDCMENLEDDLEWKLTYVGSAESSTHDQILDTIYVGPVPEGRHMFVFQVSRLVQNSILYSTYSVPRLTHPTLRRSPWLTWWGSLWSYSLAAIGQQVSNILILNAFPFIIISFKNLSGLVTM